MAAGVDLALVPIAQYSGAPLVGVAHYAGRVRICTATQVMHLSDSGSFVAEEVPGKDADDVFVGMWRWGEDLYVAAGRAEDESYRIRVWRGDGTEWFPLGEVTVNAAFTDARLLCTLEDGDVLRLVVGVSTASERGFVVLWVRRNVFGVSSANVILGSEAYRVVAERQDSALVAQTVALYQGSWVAVDRGTQEGTQALTVWGGRKARTVAQWRTEQFGYYTQAFVWRNRYWMLGTLGNLPVYAVWSPPYLHFARPLPWGTVADLHVPGRSIYEARTSTLIYADTDNLLVVVKDEDGTQTILGEGLTVRALRLDLYWADGSGASPSVDALQLQWAREAPTQLEVRRIDLHWADGSAGHVPCADKVALYWGQGRRTTLPSLYRVVCEWSKGHDNVPGVSKVELFWADGTGTSPSVDRFGVTYSQGDLCGTTPTLDYLSLQWADEVRSRQPLGFYVDRVAFGWQTDLSPDAEGEDPERVLWLYHEAGSPVCMLRLATSLPPREESQRLRCLVRCDGEASPVDAWGTYQGFRPREDVLIERPGRKVRIGVVGRGEVDFDLHVQLKEE